MIGKSLGLFFPMLGSLGEMKGSFFKYHNNGAIFPQVGKYCNMLFPILENERHKKSPPSKRI